MFLPVTPAPLKVSFLSLKKHCLLKGHLLFYLFGGLYRAHRVVVATSRLSKCRKLHQLHPLH